MLLISIPFLGCVYDNACNFNLIAHSTPSKLSEVQHAAKMSNYYHVLLLTDFLLSPKSCIPKKSASHCTCAWFTTAIAAINLPRAEVFGHFEEDFEDPLICHLPHYIYPIVSNCRGRLYWGKSLLNASCFRPFSSAFPLAQCTQYDVIVIT